MTEKGQKVRVHYKGTLDDGTVFNSTHKRGRPIEFTVGVGQMIPGFDAVVLDMSVGEKRTVRIPAREAYGEYSPEKITEYPFESIPQADELPIGKLIAMPSPDGRVIHAKVLKIENGVVHIDGNHELAGQALTFEIELLSAT